MKNRQMHTMLTRAISGILMLTIIMLSLFFYFNASSLLYNDATAQTQDAIMQSAGYIEGYLDKVKSFTDIIAMHPDTVDYLENHGESKSVKALLDLAYNSDERILSMAIISRDGSITSVGNEMQMQTSGDMMDEAWYMEAKNSEQMPALNSTRRTEFTMEKDTWVVSVSREIINDEGTHLGVVLADLDYSFFEDYLKNIPLGESGYAFVVTLDGDVIYHPDASYFMNDEKRQELIAICEAGPGYETTDGLMTFKDNIGHSDWLLVGLTSLENVQTFRSELIFSILLVGSIVLLIGFIIAYYMTQRITSPIKRLQNAMATVEKDWSKVEVEGKGNTEVMALTVQYNEMIDQIKSLMEAIKNSEKQRTKLEIKALQNQINPHFLYNTLETIVWLSEFQDYEKIIKVTKALSKLLRVAFGDEEMLISLAEELTHVTSYLEIQSERYLDMLSYEIQLPDQYANVKVPKLIVQPLVENAIYHGIKEKGEKGTIRVVVEAKDEKLLIHVKDDGKGFETDQLPSEGVGMQNVHQRIQLIYGEAYGLHVASNIKKGSQVTISLPLDD